VATAREAEARRADGGAPPGLALMTGCSGSSGGSGGGSSSTSIAGTAAADTYNSGTPKQGGSVTWTIEKTMDNWNLLSAERQHLRLRPDHQRPRALGVPVQPVLLGDDELEPAGQRHGDEHQPGDGGLQDPAERGVVRRPPINANDFVYNWEVQNGTDANIPAATTTGYQNIESVTGSDNGKTVTTVYKTPFADWKSLFTNMYPAHIAKEHGNNEASFTWFQSNPLPVSGGPFVVSSVSSDHTSVILKRNPKYYGKKPNLDQITFRAITDASQEPTALQNHEVDGIYPQPETTLVTQLKNMGSQIRYKIDAGLSFEHIDFNLKNPALGNATWGKTLRTAMFTGTDRNAILAKTIQQFQPSAVPLNSRMLVSGQKGYQDNVTQYGLGAGDRPRPSRC
jgi:peptide/nickel transport system substrate-binding protein